MPFDPKRARRLFAAGAALVVVMAVGFYLYGILSVRRQVIRKASNNIPSNVEKSAAGFNLSRSEGGKTLFTIHAASVQQYKEGGRAALHDVSIIVYGRNQDRSDQIYGADFAYDPVTKVVTAEGEVRIDLEANSTAAGSPPAAETRNLIHVKTSGLTFNENTGIAQTKAAIEFRMPEGNGSAVGATYDSHGGVLILKSAVRITSTGQRKATVTAQSATITKNPSRIVLLSAKVEEPERTVSADKVNVLLNDDNNIERITASGNLHAYRTGPKGFEVGAAEGEVEMTGANQARSGSLSGGVTFLSHSETPAEGKAGKVLLTFAAANRLSRARAQDSVQLKQGPAGKSQELHAAAVDLDMKKDGRKLEKAVTSSGPAEIVQEKDSAKTTISADRFETTFNDQNRPVSLIGTPEAKIVEAAPGKQDRVLTAKELTAKFNDKGEIATAELVGDFHYQEGTQTATAERARYGAADETIVLSGSPRVVDPTQGVTLTADSVQLNRKTRSGMAQDNVKTTYGNLTAQSGGAMLGSAEPIHVTGTAVTFTATAGSARYTKARLWQGPNIVEAPVISFDRPRRSLQAQGGQGGRVASVFVQKDSKGKLTPVNVTSDRLSYVDSERKAVFSGNVIVRAQETTIHSDAVQVILLPKKSQAEAKSASQLERIEAQGDIKIDQAARHATGSRLVYTAADEKMVLTGTPAHPPSIFDAERGQITGDSLTFFTRDGRVLVGSGEAPQTQIPNRTEDASKK
jgi:lipopolysaccharide export system protein LptA